MRRLLLIAISTLVMLPATFCLDTQTDDPSEWTSIISIYGSAGMFPIYGAALGSFELALLRDRPALISSVWLRGAGWPESVYIGLGFSF